MYEFTSITGHQTLPPPPYIKPYQTKQTITNQVVKNREEVPMSKSPKGSKVLGFQGPRSQGPIYLEVTFKYELDSKEGPSSISYIN